MASQALRMSHYCISAFSVTFPTFHSIVSGGQNSLSGDKQKVEWWLRPITPDQCGHHRDLYAAQGIIIVTAEYGFVLFFFFCNLLGLYGHRH